DRLTINEETIRGIIDSLKDVIKLKDPVGDIIDKRKNKQGLNIERVRTPLGLIGIIFEARPNIVTEIFSLCFKTGNSVILKGGSDAQYSIEYLVDLIKHVLVKNNLPESSVELINPKNRSLVYDMMQCDKYIDVIIPRGSNKLIQFVRKNSLVPVIETGAGVCHTYVDSNADLEKAIEIVYNAKTQRPTVCNALDTLALHKKIASKFLPKLAGKFNKNIKVKIFADPTSYEILKKEKYHLLKKSNPKNYGYEFLGYKMSIKTVSNFDEALSFIQENSSGHSEAIVTKDAKKAERFLKEIDAACLYHNTSTRFTDGFVFGLGAEIGTSTQKLQARGPMGLEALTTYKWIIRGSGQVRK
ncbi:MAG: glutamate-5-semialdehyde dehydrogenase, partial [Parcubacteria group bacterium]|nr:glutamate-5-semialdehyde dehydrogenase [Parcubacteria group bacterium]